MTRLPDLILMTDCERLPDPAEVIDRLPRGSAVILRHPSPAGLETLTRTYVPICRRRGLRVLVAGDARLAVVYRADGVHLPEALTAGGAARWRLWRRPDWLVTAAAHGASSLWSAVRAGADAVLLAPVFPTTSHPQRPPLGVIGFARLCRSSPLPVYGLGGIVAANARRLRSSGAVGFAGVGGIAGLARALLSGRTVEARTARAMEPVARMVYESRQADAHHF